MRSTAAMILGSTFRPTHTKRPMKRNMRADTVTTLSMLMPSPSEPRTIERMRSVRISSTIDASMIIVDSSRSSFPISSMTRAVMPTLVETRMRPTMMGSWIAVASIPMPVSAHRVPRVTERTMPAEDIAKALRP